jgi:hypothetical protein
LDRLSRRALLVQGSLALATVACMKRSDDPGPRRDHAPGAAVEGLILTARIAKQETQALHLEWALASSAPRPVVVLRHLFDGFDAQGRLLVQPDTAYVSVRADGTVDVSKKMYRAPEAPARARPTLVAPVPLGEELAPNGRMSETFTLRVPIMPSDPYGEYVQRAAEQRGGLAQGQGTAIVFHVGVFRPPPGSPLSFVETAHGRLIYPDYPSTIDAQVVLEAPAIPWSGAVFR